MTRVRRCFTSKTTSSMVFASAAIRGGQPPTGAAIVAQNSGSETVAKAILHVIVNK